MNQQTLNKLLDKYADVARPIILKYFIPTSCIAATRITIRVLKEFGVRAEPLMTLTKIFNPQFTEAMNRDERMPKDEAGAKAWMDERGAWTIGLGFGGKDVANNKIGGHLVAIIRDSNLIVDASIDQAVRPEKNIDFPGVLTSEGRSPLPIRFGIGGG